MADQPRFIVGHGLQREGKGHDAAGRFTDSGMRGKCKCGLLSDPLPSVAARKRWHAVHKAAVLAKREGARLFAVVDSDNIAHRMFGTKAEADAYLASLVVKAVYPLPPERDGEVSS